MDELIEYLKQHNTPEIVILRVENMVQSIIDDTVETVLKNISSNSQIYKEKLTKIQETLKTETNENIHN